MSSKYCVAVLEKNIKKPVQRAIALRGYFSPMMGLYSTMAPSVKTLDGIKFTFTVALVTKMATKIVK